MKRERHEFAENDRFAGLVREMSDRYLTIGELAYAVIKRGILDGTFSPGEWLRQDALAAAIGVSRIPVRSALIQLDSEGLVSYHPYKGALISTLSSAQIDEIYRLRAVLESYAIRLALPRLGDDDIEALRRLAAAMDEAEEGGDFLQARVEFFRVLYDSGRSPMLVQLIEHLRAKVGQYLLGLRVGHGEATHGQLVELVAAGDLSGAERWLSEHLEAVRSGIVAAASTD